MRLESRIEISDPTWEQVLRVLRDLDGATLTQVSLEWVGKAALLAGGGNGGRYIVTYLPTAAPDTPSYTLSDPSLSGPDVELTAQVTAEYPARQSVYLERVISAFEYFCDHAGQRDPTLTWDRDW